MKTTTVVGGSQTGNRQICTGPDTRKSFEDFEKCILMCIWLFKTLVAIRFFWLKFVLLVRPKEI